MDITDDILKKIVMGVAPAAGKAVSRTAKRAAELAAKPKPKLAPATVATPTVQFSPGMGHNGGPSMMYIRRGSDIAARLAGHPSAAEIAGKGPTTPGAGTTSIKSQKPTALSGHFSAGLLDEELTAPQQLKMENALGRTLLGIVGDTSGRHIVHQLGNDVFDTPINTQGGFQYIDRGTQGYAGAQAPQAGKIKEAMRSEDPMYVSLLMGEQSPDFAMPTSQIYGQMLQHAKISSQDAAAINEKIRNIGVPIKNKDGTSTTAYPFQHFDDIRKPGYFDSFIESLPTGTQRAYFMKGLDKADLIARGMPKVSDARMAMADPNQIGMDWGSSGYRAMVPDVERGVYRTTPDQSLTYDYGVDKVGPSYSFTGEGMGVPYALMFPDLASELRAAGKGGGLEMQSSVYKIFEGSPTRAKQLVDDRVAQLVDTFREIEDRFGREAAMRFAKDTMKEVAVTPQIIEAARKANAPAWAIGVMASGAGLLGMSPEDAAASEIEQYLRGQ